MIFALISVVFLLANLSSCQNTFTFNYNATYICSPNFIDSSGRCSKWQYKITIEEQQVACFPYFQLVMTKQGPKQMNQLQIGDQLLSYDANNNSLVYSKMNLWLHKLDQNDYQSKYLKIQTNKGSFFISPLHNIAIKRNQILEYVFAQNLTIGDILYHKQSKVQKIQQRSELGVYTPLTQKFNFFIVSNTDKSEQINEQDLVLVHCFANIQQPTFYEPFVSFFYKIFEFFGLYKNYKTIDGINPLAKFLMKTFPKLVQDEKSISQRNHNRQLQFSDYATTNNNDNDYSERRAIAFISITNDYVLGV